MLSPGPNGPAHDLVQTPDALARAIVAHFRPSGRCLDPSAGAGEPFARAMRKLPGVTVACDDVLWSRDFFDRPATDRFDWVVTNPPWSKFRPFLAHAMELSDRVVFLATLTHFVTRRRLADVDAAGFSLREALLVPQPPPPWPSSGFQLAAVLVARGRGRPLAFRRLKEDLKL
jgi:hypothetical protein